ncbi:MAG: chemotaxis protein [Defluviitaleaceae bacterium]|nr:chemotaxis protein [Defluviitaleaceae bacterium]MCL2240730.1 chemotaxis protein [Defluviitaleaceae bacterium]
MVSSRRGDKEKPENKQQLQLMEFIVAGGNFGINVAKVDEIMKYSQYPITPMPNSNPFVEGIFRPRTETMTVINLAAYMGLPPSEDEERDILIITKMNNIKTAFHVHGVMAIDNVDLSKIEKPDRTIYGEEEGMATGVAQVEERLITIIDFEKILMDINPQGAIMTRSLERFGSRPTSNKPILIVEDSPTLERLVMESLEKVGYVNLASTPNGKEAWDLLKQYKAAGGNIADHVSMVITDIEMPIMDGHRLLKLIREDDVLKDLPVVIFSTLITEDLRTIGERLKATAQVAKSDIADLVDLVDANIL